VLGQVGGCRCGIRCRHFGGVAARGVIRCQGNARPSRFSG
jgi:hypothetical protein